MGHVGIEGENLGLSQSAEAMGRPSPPRKTVRAHRVGLGTRQAQGLSFTGPAVSMAPPRVQRCSATCSSTVWAQQGPEELVQVW